MDIDSSDIVAMREQGDLKAYLLSLAGKTSAPPADGPESKTPGYHIPRKGAWPCGTAPSGPTPPPCTNCQTGETP
ncbi:hypothetical protein [Streptomyces sp. NPDC020298]|uniref:hypothetical protein n=1 Tax=unclassified Streptomyces TaxID=2593676 RepID=UPI00340278A5